MTIESWMLRVIAPAIIGNRNSTTLTSTVAMPAVNGARIGKNEDNTVSKGMITDVMKIIIPAMTKLENIIMRIPVTMPAIPQFFALVEAFNAFSSFPFFQHLFTLSE